MFVEKHPRKMFSAFVVLFLSLIFWTNAQQRFNVTSGSVGDFKFYRISGSNNPDLPLASGRTYFFNVNSPGHPFWIKTIQGTGKGKFAKLFILKIFTKLLILTNTRKKSVISLSFFSLIM